MVNNKQQILSLISENKQALQPEEYLKHIFEEIDYLQCGRLPGVWRLLEKRLSK